MTNQTSYAVFHASEDGENTYFRVNRPLELLEAATGTVAHDAMKEDTPRLEFWDFYADTEPCSKEDFDRAVSERLENTGTVSGAFEIDFDRGEFSALHVMDGWKTFRMEDVRKAMRKVAKIDGLDRDEMHRVLTDQLYGKELQYNSPAPNFSAPHTYTTTCDESH